jgi:hypothetical protein
MALQGSGPITFEDINDELGEGSTNQLDLETAASNFSGIRDTETTSGYGALAIEMREFYNKSFSAGSGTYGTRNSHALRFATEDGQYRGWLSSELVHCAENIQAQRQLHNGTPGVGGFSKFVDDYIDNDLTVGDDVYNASTGTGVLDVSSLSTANGATSIGRWLLDTTANDIFEIQTSGNISKVVSRKPATPTVSEVSKTDTQIVVNITGETRVVRTLRVYLDGSSHTTYTSGSALTAGNYTNSSVTKQHTFSSLTSGQTYAIKARYENANAGALGTGDDSNTLNITTNAGATAWSNIFTDPTTVSTPDPNDEFDNTQFGESSELTIDLANADGTTSVSVGALPDDSGNPKPTLEVKIGTSSGNYGSYATSHTVAAASRYFMKFRLTENSSQGAAGYDSSAGFVAPSGNVTITFTNNSVSATPKIKAIVIAAR